jgi:hypothetical protein
MQVFSEAPAITSVSADSDHVTVTAVHPADIDLRVSDGNYTVFFTPFTTGGIPTSSNRHETHLTSRTRDGVM